MGVDGDEEFDESIWARRSETDLLGVTTFAMTVYISFLSFLTRDHRESKGMNHHLHFRA
jgi:hypothetical protein